MHYFEGERRICSAVGGGFSLVEWDTTAGFSSKMERTECHALLQQLDEGVSSVMRCVDVETSYADAEGIMRMLQEQQHQKTHDDPEPAFYYYTDHLGSTALLIDDSGRVVQELAYMPYGEDWVDDSKISYSDTTRIGVYQFNGKERDYESGFLYYGARYHWPELWTGWTTSDPLMDRYPGMSPYAYCGWNPVKLVDPDGMEFDGYEGSYGQYQWFDKHTEQSFVDENGVKWNKVTNDQNAWEEATTIREANIQGLESLGYKRSDAERDVRLYDGKDPLFTKESHLLNSQNYTSGWETAINSDEGNAKQSPEIKKTGYSLKFYPNKGGRKGANSLGIVQTNGLGHIFEAAMEAFERKICGSSADSDPLYDMH